MYTESAAFYDALYSTKDYEGEADTLCRLIEQHKRSPGTLLLDVACGTGRHLAFLRKHFAVMGLDLENNLLEVARRRCPGIEFYHADMLDFDLGELFDVVTCLFSAIGYVKTLDNMRLAVGNMARHLKPGGVLIVEPWFSPETWHPGRIHASSVNEPELKVARMTISEMIVETGEHFSRNVYHFLVGTPQGVRYFTETHIMGLFTHDEYLDAFAASGLEVVYDPDGLTGRGLYIGRRPL